MALVDGGGVDIRDLFTIGFGYKGTYPPSHTAFSKHFSQTFLPP